MRNWTLSSLVLLGSTMALAACNSGTTADGTGGSGVGASNTGGGAATGGGSSTGGGSALGGASTGGAAASACLDSAVATGTPPMIDDFEATYEDAAKQPLPENDLRMGEWAHGTFLAPAGGGLKEVKTETTNHYLNFSCVAADVDNSLQCNTAWDKTKPWVQWASLDVGLQAWSADGVNCYDASAFTGIKFKARSTSGTDKLRIQVKTPDAKPDTGETYQSPTLSLTDMWADYEVPFAQIKQPMWSSVKTPLNVKELVAFSLVVRTVAEKTVAVDMADGEALLPYSIDIDDVQFY